MANYKIDEMNRTITARIEKLNPEELERVKTLCGLGYTFVEKVQTRKGTKRNRSYYESNLIKEDLEIFADIEENSSYQKAVSFASMIIKLGKMVDKQPEKIEALDTFRTKALTDMVDAKLYYNEVAAA